jgi:hypothetical protein
MSVLMAFVLSFTATICFFFGYYLGESTTKKAYEKVLKKHFGK